MTNQINRRSFLRVIGVTAASIPVAGVLMKPNRVYALEVPTTEVDENSAKAKQFGYLADATKVDIVKFPKRAGDAGAKQFCGSCQLMVKGAQEVAGKTGKYGVCSLFTEGLVSETGWCNMWIQKVS